MAGGVASKGKAREVEFSATVRVTINDPDVVERVTGPKGDEWRAQLYDLHTEEDVLAHLAYNCVANGVENASMLDGWADLPANAVRMELVPDGQAVFSLLSILPELRP